VPDALKLSHNATSVALPLFAHPALNVVSLPPPPELHKEPNVDKLLFDGFPNAIIMLLNPFLIAHNLLFQK
jgi:hypothetical protein